MIYLNCVFSFFFWDLLTIVKEMFFTYYSTASAFRSIPCKHWGNGRNLPLNFLIKEEEDSCFVFLGVSPVSCIVDGGTTTITTGTLHRKFSYGEIKKKCNEGELQKLKAK